MRAGGAGRLGLGHYGSLRPEVLGKGWGEDVGGGVRWRFGGQFPDFPNSSDSIKPTVLKEKFVMFLERLSQTLKKN